MKRSLRYTDVWGDRLAVVWGNRLTVGYEGLAVGDRIRFEERVWTVTFVNVARDIITLED